MDVGQRINARKIVLCYFYQCCFFSQLEKQSIALKDILEVANIFPSQEDYKEQTTKLIQIIHKHAATDDIKKELGYFVTNFFDKWTEDSIDMDYLFDVGPAIMEYWEELQEKVNTHTMTFSYSQMDTMDQALFLLGYVEWKTLQTPKEVILNELIELAKRYADEGSSRLVNGIMHKILTDEIEKLENK